MIYAPIIIPTCNRIVHLKRLIESLQKNSRARYTELYISVDVPRDERFVAGHEDVVEYVKQIDGFKSINYYIQPYNLGPYNNYYFLISEISKTYDRFIYLEDDNEVSDNFIEYMDKMLEYFENDKSVYAICARNDDKGYRGNGTYYMCPICSPYGMGHWLKKYYAVKTYISDAYFEKIGKSFIKCFRLWRNSEKQFNYFAGDLLREVPAMRNADGSIAAIDINTTIVLILENMKCAYPLINTTRNWGEDGSGVNAGMQKRVENVAVKELDTNSEFCIVDGTQQERTFLMQKRRAREIRRMAFKTNVRAWMVVIMHILLSDKLFDSFRRRILKKA